MLVSNILGVMLVQLFYKLLILIMTRKLYILNFLQILQINIHLLLHFWVKIKLVAHLYKACFSNLLITKKKTKLKQEN